MEGKGFALYFLAWHLSLAVLLMGTRGSYLAPFTVAAWCFITFFYDLLKERKIMYSGIMSSLVIAETIMILSYVKYMNGHF